MDKDCQASKNQFQDGVVVPGAGLTISLSFRLASAYLSKVERHSKPDPLGFMCALP